MRILKSAMITLALVTSLTTQVSAEEEPKTNYEEKLPYMFSEPYWEKYKAGDSGGWPLPVVNPHSTGIYSMSMLNTIDYKGSENKFYEVAAKYKHSGSIEVYYKNNPSGIVNMAYPEGAKSQKTHGGDIVVAIDHDDTSVPAYNNTMARDELVLDSSQGQWLITNGLFTRDVSDPGIGSDGTSLTTGSLSPSPWGLTFSGKFIKPEDFLMGLSKAVYGVEESRPIYMQTEPYRLARKTTWRVVTSGWPACVTTWHYQIEDWKVQDVSYINPNMMDYTRPGCGQTKYMDRGEYVVHPEGYLNNVWQRYRNDQNVYVSSNVYELYFTRLLQKGILTTDEAFAFIPEREDFSPNPKKASAFSFTRDYGNRFFSEYIGYGQSNDSNQKVAYPAWAPELGAVYTNDEVRNIPLGHNLNDKDIAITFSGASNALERALGSRYRVAGSQLTGPTSIKLANMQLQSNRVVAKSTVKIIDALKLIERAMRVEHGDMTETEAGIITRKYGAEYLDDLEESDRVTVSYLLAKGILNFENHQEYAHLYSPLPEGFAYKLIYRVANKEARLTFSKVTLTDNSELPSAFRQIEQIITRIDLNRLSELGLLTKDGELVKNDSGAPLNLISDVEFKTRAEKLNERADSKLEPRYVITGTIDDPLKYLYRDLPLVNVASDGKPLTIDGDANKLQVYSDKEKKLFNDVSEADGRHVGIKSVYYSSRDTRYNVEFYVYGDTYEDAVKFIKANLSTRITDVTTSEVETSVLTKESGAVTSNKADDIVDEVTVDKDIVINETFDLTAFSNNKTSIAGNAIVHGSSTVKVGNSTMTAVGVLPKLSDKTVVDPIGTNQLITLNIPQLNANAIDVFDPSGKKVGTTKVLQGTVDGSPSGNFADIKYNFEGFNINLLKSVDMLTLDREFEYTDFEGNKSKVKGHVVLSWKLDLPSIKEQDSLVASTMKPYITDASGSSWIFTKPSNVHLLSVWNYNMGINKAILRTVAGIPLDLPSGYFAPTVEILIDSVDSETFRYDNAKLVSVTRDLTQKQLNEIKSNFFTEVAANLGNQWVQTYIGSVSLANYIAGSKDATGKIPKNVRNSVDTELSSSTHTHIKKTGLLRGLAVENGTPVWVGMVFNQGRPFDTTGSYLDNHSGLADFNMYSIYKIHEGIKYYGNLTIPGEGEGATGGLDIPYAKDPYANLYKDMADTIYSFNSSTETISENSSSYRATSEGSILKRKGEEWVVANETEYTLDLFSKKMMPATLVKGNLVTTSSSNATAAPVLDVIKASNERTFGFTDSAGINTNLYMVTKEFTFTPRKNDVEPNVKFIAVRYGQMKPYQYVDVISESGAVTRKLEATTLKEGEVVYVPQFVSLFKSTWHLEGQNITWSKSFLGADPQSYNRGDLVQMIKEQLLAENSPNIILSDDLKEGFLDTGSSVGLYEYELQTFKVAASVEHLDNGKLVETAVLNTFNKGADTVILPDGSTASATQYLLNKKVGGYNPTYKDYENTLVIHDNKLKVATGTRLAEYTTASTVNDVSVTAMLMKGVKLINNGGAANHNTYKFYAYQDVYPPTTISPFTDGIPPDQALVDSSIADVAEPFEGLPLALDLFENLEGYLLAIKIDETWELIVFVILGACVLLSMTTLLAHILWQAPISHQVFIKLFEITGVDILALLSIRAVSIDDEDEGTPTWKRTITTSFVLGILPVLVYSLIRINRWM